MFGRIISIDWSGAGSETEGVDLRVVTHDTATGVSAAVNRQVGKRTYQSWSRDACRSWLIEQLRGETPTLVALDFGFGMPWGADRAVFESFQRMAPFGPGNPEPMFALGDVRVERPMALRGGHVRVTLTDGSGGKLKAVAWRAEETELGRTLLRAGGAIHVAGKLKADDWQGRNSVELEIEDVSDPRRVG